MKKIYQNPEIKVVKLHVAQIMAGSPGYGGTTTATSGNLARQGGFFDDEDIDEE